MDCLMFNILLNSHLWGGKLYKRIFIRLKDSETTQI